MEQTNIEFDAAINMEEFLDDDLTGIRPVKLSDVGIKFLSHTYFNNFPLAQKGKLLKCTLSTLIIYYCHKNHLFVNSTITPDQFMIDIFEAIFNKIKAKDEFFDINNFKTYYIQSLCTFIIESYHVLPEEINIMIEESKLSRQMNNMVK
jgi:hypothetical protein